MSTLWKTIRVSSEGQKEKEGPEVQNAFIDNFLAKNPKYKDYEIVRKDFVQSSTEPKFLEDRPDLQGVLSLVQQGDIVAYFNMERLSRESSVRSEFIQRLIHKKGVRYLIISDKEYDLHNDSELMILGIYSSITMKQTAEDIRRKVEAKRRLREDGFYVGGPITPGYKVISAPDGKRYVTDEESEKGEKFYHRIIDMFFEQRKSANEIALAFNLEKIPTSGRFNKNNPSRKTRSKEGFGFFWTGTIILEILKNPFYKGKIVNGQQVIPALITSEKWNKVQQEIVKRRKCGSKPKKLMLLRGLLFCSRCGNRLIPVDRVQKKKTTDYVFRRYICSCRNLENVFRPYVKECTLPPIHLDNLDEIIWNRVSMLLLSDDKLKEALLAKANQNDTKAIRERITQLEKHISLKKYFQDDLLDLHGNPRWSKEALEAKWDDYEEAISKAKSEVQVLRDQLSGAEELNQFLDTIREVTKELRKNLYKYTLEQKRNLLLKVVKKITVDYAGNSYVPKKRKKEFDRDSWDIDIELKIQVSELRGILGGPDYIPEVQYTSR